MLYLTGWRRYLLSFIAGSCAPCLLACVRTTCHFVRRVCCSAFNSRLHKVVWATVCARCLSLSNRRRRGLHLPLHTSWPRHTVAAPRSKSSPVASISLSSHSVMEKNVNEEVDYEGPFAVCRAHYTTTSMASSCCAFCISVARSSGQPLLPVCGGPVISCDRAIPSQFCSIQLYTHYVLLCSALRSSSRAWRTARPTPSPPLLPPPPITETFSGSLGQLCSACVKCGLCVRHLAH